MSEIEEFLRRAAALREQQAQKRAAMNPPPAPAPPGQAYPAQAVPPTPTAYSPAPYASPMPSSEVLDAEIIESEEVSGDDVAEYVQRHLSTQSFTSRAQRAAASIRQADDVIEARLQSTFHHQLGDLGATTSLPAESILDREEEEAARQQAKSGPSVVDMLRSPESLRHAIVISELMNPPRHRWEK